MLNLPRWCFQCGEFISLKKKSATAELCRSCLGKLPLVKNSVCFKCGAEHPSSDCREQWTRHISGFRAVFSYQPPISQWIPAFKYRRNLTAGRILRSILTKWFDLNQDFLSDIDFLIPSPIHSLRLRKRGFNQTEYLLDSQKLLPVEASIVKKRRHTPYQAGLSRSERLRSIRGAFEVVRPLDGKKILLFDDVRASGGTMEEISRCLRQAGADQIKALVLSKAV